MTKNELLAWIVEQQLKTDAYNVDSESFEGIMEMQFRNGVNKGLQMVWEHVTKEGLKDD